MYSPMFNMIFAWQDVVYAMKHEELLLLCATITAKSDIHDKLFPLHMPM